MDKNRNRELALHYAHETNAKRFNVDVKPTTEELIEEAKKFEAYLNGSSDNEPF